MSAPGVEEAAGPAQGTGRPGCLRLSTDELLEATWDALSGVYDPELGLDVVSLGLVYDVRTEGPGVVVSMTLTTPGCPASQALPEMAREAVVDSLRGAVAVEIQLVWDPPWSPTMMCDDVAGALGLRR